MIDTADYVVWADVFAVLNDFSVADYDQDGSVDIGDYNLYRSTFGNSVTAGTGADGNGNGVIDAADYALWRDTFGTRVGAARFGALDPAFGAGLPPEVVAFALSNPSGQTFDFAASAGAGEQLRSISLAGANSISITFNQGVTVSSGALTLVNLDGTTPTLASFGYDSASQTATWTYASSLSDGRYLVRLADSVQNSSSEALDGEFTNPWSMSQTNSSIFASGDQVAGGEFRFRFTILANDSDHDNIHGTTNYQRWHSYEPGMIQVSNASDELDSDYSFGDLSAREALSIAASQSGHDAIVFDPSIAAINLTLGELSINSDLTIEGPGMDDLTIDAQGSSRVFFVDSGVEATISGLTVTGGSATHGGGVYASGDLVLDGVHITANTASADGGGVYAYDTVSIDSSRIDGNSASVNGGGILVQSAGAITVNDTTIDDNEAAFGAGVYAHLGAGENLYIKSSTISNNTTVGTFTSGGGLLLRGAASGAEATIVNTTISGNEALYSGGVRAQEGVDVTLINSTIAFNRGNEGGGIWVYGATVALHNTLVAENENASGSAKLDVFGTLASASSYNLVDSGGSGGLSNGTNHNIVLTSLQTAGLASLGDYGGSTKTIALLNGSPAIDAGDDAIAAAFALLRDQRGSDRFDDGDGDSLLFADIGAFELAADEYFGTV